jgi:hypothetical protein
MTSDFVPFKAELKFSKPTTQTGTLILRKDNPSGLPQNDESVSIPVQFGDQTDTIVSLYYPNSKSGKDVCSADSVMPITVTLPKTQSPLVDSINLLLTRSLTSAEKDQGFASEFPNRDFHLLKASVVNGVATLEFTEVPGFTSGGSCRVGILAAQIEKTAKQFPTVKSVVFKPATLFQP